MKNLSYLSMALLSFLTIFNCEAHIEEGLSFKKNQSSTAKKKKTQYTVQESNKIRYSIQYNRHPYVKNERLLENFDLDLDPAMTLGELKLKLLSYQPGIIPDLLQIASSGRMILGRGVAPVADNTSISALNLGNNIVFWQLSPVLR